MKGTWQTTDNGGKGLLLAAAVIAAAVIAVPVITALAHLLEVLAIVLGAVLGLAVTAGAAVAVYRIRHPTPMPPWRAARIEADQLHPGVRAARPLPAPPPAIDAPPKQELHLHFHGVIAEDAASILGQVGQVLGAWSRHPPAAGDG